LANIKLLFDPRLCCSNPSEVTDADLENLTEEMLAVDVNNYGAQIEYNLQGGTSTSGSDVATGL
jgi:hypothetical protein